MDTPTSTGSGTHRVTILDDMTIYNALGQKATLMDALAHCQDLEIDLSHVAEVDTAGFQLLLLTKREAAQQKKKARIVAHSPAVREVLDFFNMAAGFGDPLVITAREQA